MSAPFIKTNQMPQYVRLTSEASVETLRSWMDYLNL